MTVHSAVCARSPTHHSHTDADAGAGGRGSAVRGVSPTRQGVPPPGAAGARCPGAWCPAGCRVPVCGRWRHTPMDQWSHAQAPTHATPRTDRGKVSATATSCRKVEWEKRRAAARLDMRESLRLLLLPDNSLSLFVFQNAQCQPPQLQETHDTTPVAASSRSSPCSTLSQF